MKPNAPRVNESLTTMLTVANIYFTSAYRNNFPGVSS